MGKIQIKRGLKANLPTLDVGELAFCTDTKEVFIGTASGNVLIYPTSGGTGSNLPKFVVKDSWSNSGAHTLPSSMNMIYIHNSGNNDVTVTINSINIIVKSNEEFEDVFDGFANVTITATDSFYAIASALEEGSVNPQYSVKDAFSGSSDTTHDFGSQMHDFVISNDGDSLLTYTINGLTVPVAAGDAIEKSFDPFTQVTVTTTSAFRAYARGNFNSAPADTTPPVVTASSSGGTFNSDQTITLSTEVGAVIYYTTDGSTPNESSSVYASPLVISSTSTLKFFAKDTDGNNSSVQTINFTIDKVVPTVSISPTAGTYNVTQSVILTGSDNSGGAVTVYYTTDGSTPTTSSSVYSTVISVGATTTIKYFGQDTAGNVSSVQTAVYTIDTVAPTVTASLTTGTYTSTQSVTLTGSDNSGGAVTIYYTLDGSTPTQSSSIYSDALSISSTTTLKYFGKDAAGNTSTVQTQTYTITVADTTPPTVSISPVAGSYNTTQNVTLTGSDNSGGAVTIYYTTDGSTPTTSSSVYSTAIAISATTTLKYFGQDPSGNVSAVQTALFTIDTVAPDDVTNLATSSPTNNSVTLTWTLPLATDVANFEVSHSTDGFVSNNVIDSSLVNSSSTSYVVNGLSVSTSYTFKVVAIDNVGNRSSGATITGSTASETILDSDSFTRANTTITTDGTTTLGTTTGGKTWTNTSQYLNYGIDTNQAYLQRINNGGTHYRSPVIIDAGATNYAVEVKLAAVDPAGNECIHFRCSADGTGDIMFIKRMVATSSYAISKTSGGNEIAMKYGALPTAAGDVIRVENYSNGRVRLFVNGVLDRDVMDTTALSNTKVGFGTDSSTSRFDDFKLIQLTALAADTTPPGEVSGVATSAILDTSANISWTIPSDADFYQCQLYRDGSLITTLTPAQKATTLSYTDSTLSANTKYSYVIKTVDWFGNISNGITVNVTTLTPLSLSLNTSATTDYLSLPAFSMDRIDIDCYVDSTASSWTLFAADTTANYASNVNYGSNVNLTYIDGVTMPLTAQSIPKNSRFVYRADFKTPINTTMNLFANSTGGACVKGYIYKVTCYLSGSVVAKYDMSPSFTGSSILDSSGNGHTATKNGGAHQPAPFIVKASPSAGAFNPSTSVTLTVPLSASIYYTTDGTTPTTSSTLYTGPISVLTTTTIKTLPVKTDNSQGPVATFVLVKDTGIPATYIYPNPNAGTYTTNQTISFKTSEPATTYYTIDGSTPTTSSTVYSTPFSITSTTYVKYFSVDTVGNIGSVQTATYVIDPTVSVNALSMDGVSNYVKLPSLTFDTVELTMTENKYTTLAQYFVDSRTGVSGAYALTQNNTESWGTGFNAAYKDNVAMTNSGNNVSSNVKGTFKFTTAAVGTDDINIFSSNVADQFLQGNLYNVKISNGGTVVANYDLTTQFAGSSITDESGNGKTATLNGNANWISDLCVYASIPGGTYASAKSVVLNTNRTATVYYTTDGSTPTTSSTVYSGVIAVNSNTTLKYFAVGSGGTTTTPVYTETYTFQQVSITSGLAHKFDFSKGTGSQTSIVDTVGGQFTLNLTNFKFDGTDGWTGVGLKTNATNGGYAISPDMSKFAVTNGTSTTLIYFMEFNTSYGQMYLSTSNVLGNLNLGGADSSTWGRFNIGQVSVGAGDVHAMSQYRDNIGGTGSTISIMEDNATTTASDFFMNTPAVIAMVLDATAKTASLYFNGKLKKTISINALPKYDNIIIQNVPQIAHSLYVYNRALTASEITSVSSDILK